MATEPNAPPDMTDLTAPPLRDGSLTPQEFSNETGDWLSAQQVYSTELNATTAWQKATAQEVYDNAVEAANSADIAVSTADYKGEWSMLTGAYNRGIGVSEDDVLYRLKLDVADITLVQPSLNPATWDKIVNANTVALGGNATFDTFADIATATTKDGVLTGSTLALLASLKTRIKTSVNNTTSNKGGAEYEVLTLTDFNTAYPSDANNPNTIWQSYIGVSNQYVAVLYVENSKINGSQIGLLTTNLPTAITNAATLSDSLGSNLTVCVDIAQTVSTVTSIDLSKINVDFLNIPVDASGVTGSAIKLTSSSAPAYDNLNFGVKNLILTGTRTTGNKGVTFDSDISQANTRSFLENVSISSFGEGIDFQDLAYLVKCTDVSIYSCDVCVQDLGGTDAGENISFIDSAFFNSGTAIKAHNSNGSITLIGCSIDYVEKQFDVDGGFVSFSSGHLEGDNTSRSIFVTGNGGVVNISETEIIRAGGSTPQDYYAQVDDGCVLTISGGRMQNVETNTDEFYTGVGYCSIKDIQSVSVHGLCRVLGTSASILANPTFDTLTESQFVDTATTDKNTSATVSLSAVSNELVCNKSSGGSGAFFVSAPVESGGLYGFKFDFDNTASSGDIFYVAWWSTRKIDSNGFPAIDKTEELYAAPTLANGASGTIKILGNDKFRAPAWATHLTIRFLVSSQTTSTDFKLSNFYITRIG